MIRGLHSADVPPGQAKYVYCSHGALLDVIVDIRVGSPTFGTVEAVVLEAASNRAVYAAEGLGHAFIALEDQTCMTYLCSTPYNPAAEHGLNPLDPELGLSWPAGITPILSSKDCAAPLLAEAVASGLLPSWDQSQRWYEELARR